MCLFERTQAHPFRSFLRTRYRRLVPIHKCSPAESRACLACRTGLPTSAALVATGTRRHVPSGLFAVAVERQAAIPSLAGEQTPRKKLCVYVATQCISLGVFSSAQVKSVALALREKNAKCVCNPGHGFSAGSIPPCYRHDSADHTELKRAVGVHSVSRLLQLRRSTGSPFVPYRPGAATLADVLEHLRDHHVHRRRDPSCVRLHRRKRRAALPVFA